MPVLRNRYAGRYKQPAQAVSVERGRVVLPMGRGRASIVLHLDLPEHSGACTLAWNRGFELHVCKVEYGSARGADLEGIVI